ncbi:hypothetical protein D1632_02700 [Chryseobacterium nematophagum]|uniref:MACPF domain-containing protein n=1 Tax=Chryseobacterium nematophagum TaxID=2305228 RepID=A0A3M7LDU7_9FLAO|nr:MAC/perforin domain-containing protein [Chryseobacterium nematophagum]RMZ60901.1 hypothetical protein D1632_02700 [Chryseobacterium nematophagum]
MQKQFLFFSKFLLIILLGSCSMEEFNPEEIPTRAENTEYSSMHKAGDSAYDLLGHGYNVTGEFANANSAGFQVIDIDRFKAEQAPRLVTENIFSQEYTEDYGDNAESYARKISNKIDLSADEIPLFGATLSVAFHSAFNNNKKFDAKYIYGSYKLTIKHKRLRINATKDILTDYLSPEFIQDMQTQTPEQIVKNYGTHILLDIYTGAEINTLFQAETKNKNRERAARIGIKIGIKKVFNIDIANDLDITAAVNNYSEKLSYETRGGDPSKALVGELNINESKPKIMLSSWQNSSTVNNSVLVDFGKNGLLIIYDLIKDPVKKAQLKAYVDQYLIDNKVSLEFPPTPIHQYFNGIDHFYTREEGSYLLYTHEKTEFQALLNRAPNAVPIYRYFNGIDHFYTKTEGTYPGYTEEGVEFYAFPTQQPNTVPIYKYFNGIDHFYTKTVGFYLGYTNEGIEFYAY